MSEHGATLQTFNQELVKNLEDLKLKRQEIINFTQQHQVAKEKLEEQAREIQDQLHAVNKQLIHGHKMRESYDQIINDVEEGYRKIVDTSQTLLNAVQLESEKLCKKKSKAYVD